MGEFGWPSGAEDARLRIDRIAVVLGRHQVHRTPGTVELRAHDILLASQMLRNRQQQPTAASCHSREFPQRGSIVGDVFEHIEAQNPVELVRCKRKPGDILMPQTAAVVLPPCHPGPRNSLSMTSGYNLASDRAVGVVCSVA